MIAELLSLLLSPFTLLFARRRQPMTNEEIAAFYKSVAWARLRYRALKLHGAKCMICLRRRGVIVVDHIRPIRTHPHLRLKLWNLQIACSLCNRGKSSDDRTDWRKPEQRRLARSP